MRFRATSQSRNLKFWTANDIGTKEPVEVLRSRYRNWNRNDSKSAVSSDCWQVRSQAGKCPNPCANPWELKAPFLRVTPGIWRGCRIGRGNDTEVTRISNNLLTIATSLRGEASRYPLSYQKVSPRGVGGKALTGTGKR